MFWHTLEIHCKSMTTIKVINISTTSHICLVCVCAQNMSDIPYSTFPVQNTLWLTLVTGLYRSPELTHLAWGNSVPQLLLIRKQMDLTFGSPQDELGLKHERFSPNWTNYLKTFLKTFTLKIGIYYNSPPKVRTRKAYSHFSGTALPEVPANHLLENIIRLLLSQYQPPLLKISLVAIKLSSPIFNLATEFASVTSHGNEL